MADDRRMLWGLLDVYHADPIHVWTGPADRTIDGTDYLSARGLLDLSDLRTDLATGAAGGAIRIAAGPDVIESGPDGDNPVRRLLLGEHIPPLRVRVRYLISEDGGATTHLLPHPTRGLISGPTYDAERGAFALEVVDPDIRAHRAPQIVWSHEAQTRRYPDDHGWEYLREMAQDRSAFFPRAIPDDDA